jgi:hypothetical protein
MGTPETAVKFPSSPAFHRHWPLFRLDRSSRSRLASPKNTLAVLSIANRNAINICCSCWNHTLGTTTITPSSHAIGYILAAGRSREAAPTRENHQHGQETCRPSGLTCNIPSQLPPLLRIKHTTTTSTVQPHFYRTLTSHLTIGDMAPATAICK